MTETIIQYTPSAQLRETFPEFVSLEIYGTTESPLFPSGAIRALLGIGRIQLGRDFTEGVDYIRPIVKCPDGGMRERIMFTEQGLYNIVGRSSTELGKRFRMFIYVVMKELRLHGKVTLEDALRKAELRSRAFESQLDEEHQARLAAERARDKYFETNMRLHHRLLKLTPQREGDPEAQLHRVKTKLFRNVHIYKRPPPRDLRDEFPEDDDLEPSEDQEICFEISLKERKEPSLVDILAMPTASLSDIRQLLSDRGFNVVLNDKVHPKLYRGTINELRDILDELI